MPDTKLSSLEYKILQYINDTNACHYIDVISADSIPASSSEIRDLLGYLVDIKAVYLPPLPADLNFRTLSLSPFGASLLQQFEETAEQERLAEEKRLKEQAQEKANQETKRKKDQRFRVFDALVGLLSLLVAVGGIIVTLVRQ